MRNMLKPVAASFLLVALAGCATTSDLNALQADVDKANATAAQAAADAAEAKATANAALAASQETSEKLDRMFKKSMSK